MQAGSGRIDEGEILFVIYKRTTRVEKDGYDPTKN